MPESKIGRYEIVEELGEGGMSAVFLGHDPYLKRTVAIKLLSYELTSDPLFQDFFFREAKIIASLEHPAIVPIFDFGLHGTQPFIVMRHMPSGTLQERLEQDHIKLRQLARIIDRVAEGLDAAQAQEIVHRDIKPSNILFDTSGDSYVADFGLAALLQQPTGLTGSLFIGTPEYMSPEQVLGEKVSGRSDIYSLGVVLYRALTGRLPYQKSSSMDTAVAHVKEPVPRIREVMPDLPPMWDEIIGRALAKKPADRYATAGELSRDVQDAASNRWHLRKLTSAL